jgi:hypothetical protein
MSKRPSYWRTERLAVEVLEPRTTPVGNVTASLAGGTLTLTGDQFANEISITTLGLNIVVTGLNGTTVNGAATGSFLAALVSAITANLGAGDDSISITSVTLSGNLTINSGSGADLVSIDGVSAASMLIDAGTGNDSISIGSVSSVNVTAGNLVIRGQSGHDTLAIGTNPPLGVTINGDLDVDMGTGNDSVAIGDTTLMASAVSVGGKVTIKLGSGNDSVAAVFSSVGNLAGSLVDGGAGPDTGFALDLATNSRLKTRSIP